jgi:Caspase domain
MREHLHKSALIIGNSGYSDELFLSSPILDAEAMRETLEELDFKVTRELDLRYDQLLAAVVEFADSLKKVPGGVGLFYFSGHGLQDKNDVYILPTDFDDAGEGKGAKLIKFQSIVDRISTDSDVRIVLLDACRSESGRVVSELRSKSAQLAPDMKGIYVGDDKALVEGVKEIKAARNTFIAFAAASNEEAYVGNNRPLSPFTEAFVRHMGAVDLPLTNLTSRVRQEVYKLTEGKQKTWDQSSLDAPYFFNPGSSLLFTGNLVALIGLLLSLAPYTLVLHSDKTWPWAAVAGLLPLLSLGILLYGMQSVYERLRGNFESEALVASPLRSHILASLRRGGVGGYLGSFVAALGVTLPVHMAWVEHNRMHPGALDPVEPLGAFMLEIAIASAIIACLLGVLSLFFSRFRIDANGMYYVDKPSNRQVLLGAAFGGMMAGLIAAPVLMIHFGRMARPEVTPMYLLPGGGVWGCRICLCGRQFRLRAPHFAQASRQRARCGVRCPQRRRCCGARFRATVPSGYRWLGYAVAREQHGEQFRNASRRCHLWFAGRDCLGISDWCSYHVDRTAIRKGCASCRLGNR